MRVIIIHEARKSGKEIIVHYLYSGTIEFSLHNIAPSTVSTSQFIGIDLFAYLKGFCTIASYNSKLKLLRLVRKYSRMYFTSSTIHSIKSRM